MRDVLHATAWYAPHDIGGTEVYLEGLVSELSTLGISSTVIVPRKSDADETYAHASTLVETYPVNEQPAPGEMRGGKPHLGFEKFLLRLRNHPKAIYHQHSWSRGCGPHHLRAAREMGFPTVLTVHMPGNICLRGTMLRFGATPCDGRVEEQLCGACWAHSRGMPESLARAVASMPSGLAKISRSGGTRLATALSARALGAEGATRLREMIEHSDRIVAVCQWLYDALVANGVPRAKLALSRQGVSRDYREAAGTAATKRRGNRRPLRLLYLGRWHAVKGIDVVVRAIRTLPVDVDVLLSIHAVPGLEQEAGYEAKVRALAGADRRILFKPSILRADLAAVMAEHDVLVVPSVWFETGPLAVLEAQAAGLYVIGSRLGGIAELVDETDAGELIEAGSAKAWAKSIERLSIEHTKSGLPRPVRPVRTMDAAAADMAEIYQSL